MKAALAALALLACAAAACSPDERGWCRVPAEYSPAGTREPAGAGALAVISPQGDGPGRFFSDLLARDFSYAGYFSRVSAGEDPSAAFTLRPGTPRLEYSSGKDGCRVHGASAEIRLFNGEALVLERKYARSWGPDSAPSCGAAWELELPAAMLEIRRDAIAAARQRPN